MTVLTTGADVQWRDARPHGSGNAIMSGNASNGRNDGSGGWPYRKGCNGTDVVAPATTSCQVMYETEGTAVPAADVDIQQRDGANVVVSITA